MICLKKIPSQSKLPLLKKSDIDRSTLYSFNGPFQLRRTDVGNLEFLGKSAVDPKYCLFFVDIYSAKIYTYPMKS